MKHGIAKAAPVIRWQATCPEHPDMLAPVFENREEADAVAAFHNSTTHPNRTKEESTH